MNIRALLAAFALSSALPAAAAQSVVSVSYFTENGAASKEGDTYRLTLVLDRAGDRGTLIARLDGRTSAGYAELHDLEPLGQVTGEAIVLQENTTNLLHLRSMMDPMEYEAGGCGPWLVFKLDRLPPSATYRLWVETRRGGRMLTFPLSASI
jgi:hypothetical protein